jgi:hypothetical protein
MAHDGHVTLRDTYRSNAVQHTVANWTVSMTSLRVLRPELYATARSMGADDQAVVTVTDDGGVVIVR